jgi:hypothetical protein
MPGYFLTSNSMGFWESALCYPPNRLFLPEKPNIPETLSPALRTVEVFDAGRSWAANTQNVNVIFSEACVNGVSKTLTYLSGSGSQIWVMTIGSLIKNNDIIRFTYDLASGDTKSTSGAIEITGVANIVTPNTVSKRIRFVLCDSADALVANETVKSAILEYDSGTGDRWMILANKASVTTDANGQFDALYAGPTPTGGTVIVSVFRAVENMIVTDIVL